MKSNGLESRPVPVLDHAVVQIVGASVSPQFSIGSLSYREGENAVKSLLARGASSSKT